jgi:hypothetical protein
MRVKHVAAKLGPRKLVAFVLTNVALGLTYFISAPSTSPGSVYNLLGPLLTQQAAADNWYCAQDCNGYYCIARPEVAANCTYNGWPSGGVGTVCNGTSTSGCTG